MKLLSFLTLSALLSISACSHYKKSCCAKKEATSCSKPKCDKDSKCSDGSCKKEEKKCDDGSCSKEEKKCSDGNCQKKP